MERWLVIIFMYSLIIGIVLFDKSIKFPDSTISTEVLEARKDVERLKLKQEALYEAQLRDMIEDINRRILTRKLKDHSIDL